MGVGTCLYLGSKSKKLHPRKTFRALVIDLIRDRIVDRPCSLYAGSDLQGDRLRLGGESAPEAELLYHGGSSAELLAALDQVPADRDLGLVFAGFALEANPGLASDFEDEAWVNNPVQLLALTDLRTVVVGDPEGMEDAFPFQTYLRFESDRGPEYPPRSVETVLTRHLGKLMELCGYY